MNFFLLEGRNERVPVGVRVIFASLVVACAQNCSICSVLPVRGPAALRRASRDHALNVFLPYLLRYVTKKSAFCVRSIRDTTTEQLALILPRNGLFLLEGRNERVTEGVRVTFASSGDASGPVKAGAAIPSLNRDITRILNPRLMLWIARSGGWPVFRVVVCRIERTRQKY